MFPSYLNPLYPDHDKNIGIQTIEHEQDQLHHCTNKPKDSIYDNWFPDQVSFQDKLIPNAFFDTMDFKADSLRKLSFDDEQDNPLHLPHFIAITTNDKTRLYQL